MVKLFVILVSTMLRNYAHTENWRLLDQALEMFIELPPRLSLIGFSALSPDSFIWKIYDGETVYYLYAEDYVPDLDHVRTQVLEFCSKGIALEFVPVKQHIAFEDSTPNKTAQVYKPPHGEYEFMQYAGQSGYDFVFLLKSDETMSE